MQINISLPSFNQRLVSKCDYLPPGEAYTIGAPSTKSDVTARFKCWGPLDIVLRSALPVASLSDSRYVIVVLEIDH